jgi:hypothetical protein
MESEFRKSPESLAVLVVGTDTLMEVLPARPIQLAHACGALGFDLVIPLSWGDELVAEAALRALETRPPAPAILCSCPLVRQRLLQAGGDLATALVAVAASPVAVARHLRSTLGKRLGSLSFVGKCPGAAPPDYDVSYEPAELLGMFRDRGIHIQHQPDVFLDRVPPDRRRFVSLPGGCPTPEALWQRCNERTLVEIESQDLALDVAQHLMSPQSTLVDVATSVGCFCSGVTTSATDIAVRVAVASIEPPRSSTPVISDAIVADLDANVHEPAKSFAGTTYGTAAVPDRPPMAVTPPNALRYRR